MNEQHGSSQKETFGPQTALSERWHSLPLLLFMVAIGGICVLLARPFFSALAWAVGLLEALLVLFFLFYFLRDQEPAVQRLRSLLPLTDSEADEFLAWQVDTLYATLYGTLLVGLIQGLLGG